MLDATSKVKNGLYNPNPQNVACDTIPLIYPPSHQPE